MKKLLALLLALACVFALAACAAKEETPELPADPTDPVVSEEVTEPAASEDDDLAYITAKGSLVIGVTDYEPMDYKDASGKWIGFDAEVAEAVAAKLGVTPVFQEIDWDTKEIELAGKTIDVIWNGLTVNDDRRLKMDFSVSYMDNEQVVVVRAGGDGLYKDASSFAGKTVVAEQGSAGETAAADLTDSIIVPVSTQAAALLEVKSGSADAAVIDVTMAGAMTGEGTDYADLIGLDISLTNEEYAVGFRLGSSAAAAVNAAFEELKADGTLAAIAEKYDLSDRLLLK